jgi:transposase InsO family protein
MDVFSRRMIGWSMQPTLACDLVLAALQMALHQRERSHALIQHSDRGSQYARDGYQAGLAAAGIGCSMSRRGNCCDNAPVESFFGTLKTALIYRQADTTRAAARQAIFE